MNKSVRLFIYVAMSVINLIVIGASTIVYQRSHDFLVVIQGLSIVSVSLVSCLALGHSKRITH
ncbi:MAG: hypothetical protein K1X47_14865 [Cyclobacteriaceae bacterium]|nr:hypothetical protein [Cyclobacteriaceae bacterium]